MNKWAILGAVTAAIFCNSATSVELFNNDEYNLELTGYVDVYGEYLRDSGNDESTFRVASGGMSSTRASLHGEYRIKPGMEAFFRVGEKFSFNTDDDGIDTDLRRAFVGVRSDKLGSLSFGKQFTTSYNPVGYADPNWTSAYSLTNNMIWFYAPWKKKHELLYHSPEFGPFQLSAMYAFGRHGDMDGRTYGGAIRYSEGPLFIALISEKEYSTDLYNENRIRHSWNNYLSVVYRMGSFVPTFIFSTYDGYYKYAPWVGFKSKGWATQLGFRWHATENDMIHFSYVHREDNGSSNAIGTADGITAGIIHNLSDQMDVYMLVSHIWNDKNAQNGYPVTWTGSQVSLQQGQNPTGVAVGFRYQF